MSGGAGGISGTSSRCSVNACPLPRQSRKQAGSGQRPQREAGRRRSREEGESEGGGQGQASGGRPSPPTPGPSQPSPQLPRQSQGPVRTRARCLGPGTAWRVGEGAAQTSLPCLGGCGAPSNLCLSTSQSLSVSPHLPVSEMEMSPCLTLCVSPRI